MQDAEIVFYFKFLLSTPMPTDGEDDTVGIIVEMIRYRSLVGIDILSRVVVLVRSLNEEMSSSIPHCSGYILLPTSILIIRILAIQSRVNGEHRIRVLEGALICVAEVDIYSSDRHDLHSGTQGMHGRDLLKRPQIVLQRDQRIMGDLESHRGAQTERHMKIRRLICLSGCI